MTTEPDDSDLEVRVQRRFAKLEAGTADPLARPPTSPAPDRAPAVDPDALAAAVARALRSELAEAVHDAAADAARASVATAVREGVAEAVRAEVAGAVRGTLAETVQAAVNAAVDAAVHAAVNDAVAAVVPQAVGEAVQTAVQTAVHSAVQTAVQTEVGGAVRDAGAGAADASVSAEAAARVAAHVDDQLDVLRQELEAAFEEVVGRIAATDRALRVVYEQLRAQQEQAGSSEPAPVDLTPIVPSLVSLDEKLSAIGRMLDAQAAELVRVTEGAVRGGEAPGLAATLETLHRELTAQSADLSRIAHAVVSPRPGEASPAGSNQLEELVRRTALSHAADLANLRTDLDVLATSVREQTNSLTELRKHVAWIRQRLLS